MQSARSERALSWQVFVFAIPRLYGRAFHPDNDFYIVFWAFSFQLNMGADCIQQTYQICQESVRERALSWQIVLAFDTPRLYGRVLHPENDFLHLVLNIQFST